MSLVAFFTAFCGLLLGKTLSSCTESLDVDSDWLYVKIQNHRLMGHAAETSRVFSAHRCYLQCNLSSSCLSFNYNRRNGICELNEATSIEYPQKLVEEYGVVYIGSCRDLQSYRNLANVDIEEHCEFTGDKCLACIDKEPYVCTFEDNRDRVGSDIIPPSPILVSSAPACCRSCREASRCRAWTYVKYGAWKGRCFVKYAVPDPTEK